MFQNRDKDWYKKLELENVMFVECESNLNVQSCLNDAQGYQVRNIPVTLTPKDASYKGSLRKELTIVSLLECVWFSTTTITLKSCKKDGRLQTFAVAARF